jgi:hypothetical protein
MSKKRKANAKRFRRVRKNASVGSAQRSIAREMGLPEGSIKLVLPSGRKARADASVASLRGKYD